jgi:predicted acylesterase/phospholipase RssA
VKQPPQEPRLCDIIDPAHIWIDSNATWQFPRPRPRIGLVLSGGGAKGAYEIGAWKAFMQAGIQFDAFAGTSIGAFNVALMQTRSQAQAEEIWLRLSTLRRAKTSRFFLLTLALVVLSLLCSPHLRRLRPKSHINAMWVVIGTIFIAAVLVSYFGNLDPTYKGRLLLTSMTVVLVIGHYVSLPLLKLFNLGVLRHSSLEELLDEAIDTSSLVSSDIPVFVTAAREGGAGFGPGARSYEHMPAYVRLNSVGADVARSCLLASMAVPHGLFGALKVGDKFFIDGGMADNAPIYPLVVSGCERIYVVHLSPDPRDHGLLLTDPHDLDFSMRRTDDRVWMPMYRMDEAIRIQRLFEHVNRGLDVETARGLL